MLISLNWLKKFVEVPKGFSPEELGLKLTLSTVEIEGVYKQGQLLDNVVVGKVLAADKHPDADKLNLAIVNTGKDNYKVVCAGSNLKKGMLVALAKVGAKIKCHGEDELTEIKPIKIRGVESNGVICASYEIGIDHVVACKGTEIADLSQLNLEVGKPLAEALGLDDIIFEVDNKSMTHRPDLWGVYGLARELAAILKTKLTEYKTKEIKDGKGKKLKVEIRDKDKCRRYTGVVIDGIKIAPSPEWLSKFLEASGVRSINNIVDITNYVMLELGQPMHAFDWRDIAGGKIIVETAQKGEKFVTLDNQERVLDEEMLLVRDDKRAVDLAGIMGGQNSEIKDDTTTVLFEAANFDASNIRKTSVKLGLRTEASARFEKGLSPLLAEIATRKAVELALELIPGAKVASNFVDENNFKFKAPEIELDLDWLNRRIGMELKKEEVVDILERLQFTVKDKKDILLVEIPWWRATGDISLPEDLVEEVARIYGYDNIKPVMPIVEMKTSEVILERQLERRIKGILTGSLALVESYNYSFVDRNRVDIFGFSEHDHWALANYLTEEQSLLRISLIPGLLKNTIDNLRFYDKFSLFELGRSFLKKSGEYIKSPGSDDRLPFQHKVLSGVVINQDDGEPFFTAKGVLESLFEQLDIDFYFQPLKFDPPKWIEVARVLEVVVKGKAIGTVGEISAYTRSRLGIEPAVGYFELDFTELVGLVDDRKKYKELPKFPPVLRDLAMLLDDTVAWEDIKKTVKKAGGELVDKIELFDVYQGDKIEAGKRSLAFHLEYHSPERTLEAEEVDKIEKKIIGELEKKFGAKIR